MRVKANVMIDLTTDEIERIFISKLWSLAGQSDDETAIAARHLLRALGVRG